MNRSDQLVLLVLDIDSVMEDNSPFIDRGRCDQGTGLLDRKLARRRQIGERPPLGVGNVDVVDQVKIE